MPRCCWRLLIVVAIVWATSRIVFYHSYDMALSVAAGYCLARGIRSWERLQAQRAAAAEDEHDLREQ